MSEINGLPLTSERSLQIQKALEKILETPQKITKFIKKPIKHSSFKRKTRLRFLENASEKQTAFELFALDRDGLLAQIGHIFNQLNLNLINAKITTIGERVEDFFVVSTSEGKALTEQQKQILKETIMQEFDSE